MKWKDILHKKKVLAIAAGAVLLVAVIALLLKNGATVGGYVEVKAEKGSIQPTILSTGTVSPENRLEIKPPIAGRIDEVLVKEGDKVKKGQILIKMSSTERAALLDAAMAQGPAELRRWETYYKAAPIMAPIDGTVIVRGSEPGQTVTNSDVILVMSDNLSVKARVDETDIGSIQLNQRADTVLDAYPDDTIAGTVDKIAYDSKTVNNVTTYIVDVLPDVIPPHMRSGMTANVTFFLDPKNDVLTLPSNAVNIKNQRSFVLLPPESKPVERDVVTGTSDDSKIEIVQGLKEGENVLIEKLKWRGDDDPKRSNPFLPSRPKAKSSK